VTSNDHIGPIPVLIVNQEMVVRLGAVTGVEHARLAIRAFVDAGVLAHLLGRDSSTLGSVFAIVLLDASIFGAAAVTLASSYAFGDVFGLKHSLHRGFGDAKPFCLSYTGMAVVAAAVVLIPGAPLGLITTAVEALAGLLLPSATVFLLLCNDREVLGPWANRPWLNGIAGVIVGVLLLLSGILMATTIFPNLNVVSIAIGLGVAFAVCAVATSGVLWRIRRRRPERPVLEQLAETLTMTLGDRKHGGCRRWPFSSPFNGRPALG
jgi:Mn2+/Fe2+ NRAMP family transporter